MEVVYVCYILMMKNEWVVVFKKLVGLIVDVDLLVKEELVEKIC